MIFRTSWSLVTCSWLKCKKVGKSIFDITDTWFLQWEKSVHLLGFLLTEGLISLEGDSFYCDPSSSQMRKGEMSILSG